MMITKLAIFCFLISLSLSGLACEQMYRKHALEIVRTLEMELVNEEIPIDEAEKIALEEVEEAKKEYFICSEARYHWELNQ